MDAVDAMDKSFLDYRTIVLYNGCALIRRPIMSYNLVFNPYPNSRNYSSLLSFVSLRRGIRTSQKLIIFYSKLQSTAELSKPRFIYYPINVDHKIEFYSGSSITYLFGLLSLADRMRHEGGFDLDSFSKMPCVLPGAVVHCRKSAPRVRQHQAAITHFGDMNRRSSLSLNFMYLV